MPPKNKTVKTTTEREFSGVKSQTPIWAERLTKPTHISLQQRIEATAGPRR